MSTKKHIDQEVEKTLASLDSIERASTDDFFYSRLSAKIENRHTGSADADESKDLSFIFSMAAVFLVLVLNVILISQYNFTITDTAINREEVIEELAYEYQVLDLNYYETYEAE
jgi:hypothetical protein